MGHQNQGRGVAYKYQGKYKEGGGPISLDDRKEGHKNSAYWEQVDWVAASESNVGTI